MSIIGRIGSERERLLGMTDAERAWRRQWLKDQELSANEPRTLPEMYKATHNPIRRFYRWPLDQFGKFLTPIVGANHAEFIRYATGKVVLGTFLVYATYYFFKYHKRDWTRKSGWKLVESRGVILPGDPGYPYTPTKTKGADYIQRGFQEVEHLNL